MNPDELRLEALRMASLDAKHQGYVGQSNSMNWGSVGPPDAAAIVTRAEVYLKFLIPPPASKKRRPYHK